MWARSHLRTEDLDYYAQDARDYALSHGLVLRYSSLPDDGYVGYLPITLLPSPIPSRLYQECLDIQPIINTLLFKLANDTEVMEESLTDIMQVDKFTKNLFDIHQFVQLEGLAQPMISCISRADYMLDKYHSTSIEKNHMQVRQVEVNTISCGLSALSVIANDMHQYLLTKHRIKHKLESLGISMPKSDSLEVVAAGLIDAFDFYASNKPASYILLVAENERSLNFSDQFKIEKVIFDKRPDIRFVRRRFCGLKSNMTLGPNKELLIDNSKEVAVVYFRFGYDPSNYNFDGAWETRLTIERSKAIKCPSINFHISGAKKFQQIFSNQEKIERFLNPSDAKKLSEVFCHFWSLESNTIKGRENFNFALNSTKELVLKPQREGGGHNMFGNDVKTFLKNMTHTEERAKYILMDFIDSPKEKNWLSSHGDKINFDTFDELVSELGIFGSILGDKSDIKANRSGGFLVRSKKHGVREGSVMSGQTGISSLLLVDDCREDIDLSMFFVD